MKKLSAALVLLLLAVSLVHGAKANSVVANIGNIAITSFDLRKTYDFYQSMGSDLIKDPNFSFKELLFDDCLLYLTIGESNQLKVKQEEVDKFITSITNVNLNDQSAVARAKHYQMFPEQYKLMNKKNQIIRGLITLNENLKTKANDPIPEKEIKAYYEANKSRPPIMGIPKVDLIVIAAVPPRNLGLTEMEDYEKTLTAMANALKKSDDFDSVTNQYRSIKLESYSGKTGFHQTSDLMYQNGIPEEVMRIAFVDSMQLPTGLFTMKRGSVFGPQAMVLSQSQKKTYLIVKLLNRELPKPRNYQDVKPDIEAKLKDDRVYSIMEKFIIDKIQKGEIIVNILDKNYEGAYNEFIRR